MICVAVCASEAAREPMKKMKIQLSNTVFRENMSDSRPYSNWKDVEVLQDQRKLVWHRLLTLDCTHRK